MTKKKILVLAMTLSMVAILLVGGTMAYFTDTDYDKNVMISGNVQIVQNETDRNGKAYQDNQKLVPAVYDELKYEGSMENTNGDGSKLDIFTMPNVIDKVVSVTNKGTEPAYVRTILLIETNEVNDLQTMLHAKLDKSEGQEMVPVLDAEGKEALVKLGTNYYTIGVCTYTNPVAAGKTTAPSLMQIFVNKDANNDWFAKLPNGDLNIIALSQAVQSQGFEDAATALNTAFGEVTAESVYEWYYQLGELKTFGEENVIGG